ncbi:MAG TPA: class I SAM-dependent methyltransferase [Methylomirabilota bacterium]|nr:class I SAM-dependent methyltransferase [Methylomirabilota bacterium]
MDFDRMAATYDTLEPWYAHLYDVLHALLRAELAPPAGGPPRRALDAGCGTGFQAAVLESLGYRTHGLDLSAGLLAVARRQRVPAVLTRGTIETLPYEAETFDAVTCCGSTLSFVDAPALALAEIGRVLRPGGLLLLECEHRWSLDLLWAAVSSVTGDPLGYRLRPRDVWRQVSEDGGVGCRVAYPGYGPLRLFRMREVRALLEGARLEPVRVWGIHILTNLIPSTVLHRDRLGRSLAALYQILCWMDDGVRRLPASARLANSLVVLARKRGVL